MDKGIAKVLQELFDKHRIAYHNVVNFPSLPRRKERSKVITSLTEENKDG
jgi:hypothetical protein